MAIAHMTVRGRWAKKLWIILIIILILFLSSICMHTSVCILYF